MGYASVKALLLALGYHFWYLLVFLSQAILDTFKNFLLVLNQWHSYGHTLVYVKNKSDNKNCIFGAPFDVILLGVEHIQESGNLGRYFCLKRIFALRTSG